MLKGTQTTTGFGFKSNNAPWLKKAKRPKDE